MPILCMLPVVRFMGLGFLFNSLIVICLPVDRVVKPCLSNIAPVVRFVGLDFSLTVGLWFVYLWTHLSELSSHAYPTFAPCFQVCGISALQDPQSDHVHREGQVHADGKQPYARLWGSLLWWSVEHALFCIWLNQSNSACSFPFFFFLLCVLLVKPCPQF